MPVPQPYLRDGSFITDASSTDFETEQSSASCVRWQLLVKGAPTTPTKKILMILSGSFHRQSRILNFSFPDVSNGTYILGNSVRITSQKKRNCGLLMFYMFIDGLCYWHDIEGLFQVMGNSFNPSEWRLVIDSSFRSLKVFCCTIQINVSLFAWLIQFTWKKISDQNIEILLSGLKYDN